VSSDTDADSEGKQNGDVGGGGGAPHLQQTNKTLFTF
jgi:hypothetical protein